MRHLYILMILLLSFPLFQSHAQSKYFEKELDFGGDLHSARTIKVTQDNQFIIGGNLRSWAVEGWHPYVSKLYLHGDTIWTYLHSSIGEQIVNSFILIEDNSIAITGCRSNTLIANGCDAYIRLINSDGILITSFFAGDIIYGTSGLDLENVGENYLLGGAVATLLPGSQRPYFSKINASGTQLWQRQYIDYTNKSFIQDIMPAGDGGFYAVGFANFDFIFNESDVLFMKLDSLGYLEWDTLYNIGAIDEAIYFEKTSDEGFLLCGKSNEHAMLMKTSATFDIIWKREYFTDLEYSGIVAFSQDENEDIVFSGIMVLPVPSGTQEHAEAFIAKADGETGELLWERRYGKPSVNDYSYDMTATPDGGYIFCGRADTLHEDINTIYSDVYLVKTNCMGLLTEPVAAFNYDAVDAFNVQFINQSQYIYPDSTDGGRYLWSFGDGTTSNEPHPQHTFPEVADYEVTLTAIVCSDTSVYTQTVSTEPTSINPQARAESITVLPPIPNPAASGLPIRIGFEFPHFIQNKTAVVHLYDINGRLLHEGQQTGGGVYELPTSRLTAGMYLYGVEWEGNVLQRGKLTLF